MKIHITMFIAGVMTAQMLTAMPIAAENSRITALNVLDSEHAAAWSVQQNLQVGSMIYGDRDVYYTALPEALTGAEWVQTACDSKAFASDQAVFTAAADITVFVAIDIRVTEQPSWLNGWKDTGCSLANNNAVSYHLYSADYKQGSKVTLGTNGQSSGCVNYGVIITAAGAANDLYLKGDANADGKADIADVTALQKYLLTETKEISMAADLDGNGRLNACDLTQLKRHVMNPVEVTPIADPPKPVEDTANDIWALDGWASVSGNGLKTTTGGAGGETVTVSNKDDFEKYSKDNKARTIIVKGTITCGGYGLTVGSNKTIVGYDENAAIKGGIYMTNVSNVIIQNLTFHGFYPNSGPDDCISARNVHHLWLNHLELHDAGDGIMDITLGSDYITVSWCKFYYNDTSNSHRLCSLVGSGTGHDDTDKGKLNATYHHCWFASGVHERQPRMLYGKGHVYNNYYTCEGNLYCIGVGCYASVLVEGCYFKNVRSPHIFMYTHALPCYITARDCVYDNTTGSKDTGLGGGSFGNVAAFTNPPYEYTVDDAASVPEIVPKYVGPQAK